MKTKNKLSLLKQKKADMNFWMVMLIVALVFMVVIFFIMTGTIEKYTETTSKIQDQSNKDLQKSNFFSEDSTTSSTTDTKTD